MQFQIEYLGEGTIVLKGVGTLGNMRFDRKTKKRVRVTKANCSESAATQFFKDKRFKIYGLIQKTIKENKGDK